MSRHVNNSYHEHKLDNPSTVAKNATVQIEGGREVLREIEFYNPDVIISVCYCVKSKRIYQFRKWATNILKDYAIKGYAINQVIFLMGNRFN